MSAHVTCPWPAALDPITLFTGRSREEKPMPSLKRPAELQNWRPEGLQQPRKPQRRRGLLRRLADRLGMTLAVVRSRGRLVDARH